VKPFLDPALAAPLQSVAEATSPTAAEAAPARQRIRIAALLVALVFFGLGARAVQLAFVGAPAVAEARGAPAAQGPHRALVEDRNGVLLIGAGEGQVLIARRELVWDAPETARALAEVIPGLDAAALTRRLTERPTGVVYVRRGLSQAQINTALDLGLAGLDVEPEPRRLYPNGTLAGQTLGYTDIDLLPLAGVESGMDRLIQTQASTRLSLDIRVQHAMEAELAAGATAAGAQSGAGVVLDGQSGEILALASWPFLDPNRPGEAGEDNRRHHAVGARYELGSSVKPLTFAMALDAGVLRADERLDTTRGVHVADLFFEDEPPSTTPIGIDTALARSSNVAAIMTALRVGGPLQTTYLQRLGFDERFEIGLPEAAAHRLVPPGLVTDVAARGYGYALLISPLALASAYTVFVNDGARVGLTLRPRPAEEAPLTPVFSAAAARTVTAAMARALPEGTGWRAAQGVRLAGKTGTARRQTQAGVYDTQRPVVSFAAVFPAEAPRYVMAVVVDGPVRGAEEGAGATGGGVAAPIAARTAMRIAPFLGLRLASTPSPARDPHAAQNAPEQGRSPG